jgi:peptidyl-prolyl cis-trans isomerase B (cyclophilin B)
MLRRALTTAVLLLSVLVGAPADAAVKCAPTTVQPRKSATVVQPTARLKAKTYVFTVRTNCGTVKIAADAKAAPITVRNMAALAKNRFFDKSLCHRLSTEQIFIVQCGDPTASGTGGPGFSFTDENLPTKLSKNRYPAGTVAMANAGANTNGSQFFIVYRDGTVDLPANYTIWGHVTAGLDILKAIAAKGTTTGGADGWPAQAIAVLSVTVSEGTP